MLKFHIGRILTLSKPDPSRDYTCFQALHVYMPNLVRFAQTMTEQYLRSKSISDSKSFISTAQCLLIPTTTTTIIC